MTNLQRLELEIKGIELSHEEMWVYLDEAGLNHCDDYDPKSASNKKAIYETALSILESVANNPTLMKSYKSDDITISQFAENLQARIDQLSRKIRTMPTDETKEHSNFFMLFSN
jgi:hypothetical protein